MYREIFNRIQFSRKLNNNNDRALHSCLSSPIQDRLVVPDSVRLGVTTKAFPRHLACLIARFLAQFTGR